MVLLILQSLKCSDKTGLCYLQGSISAEEQATTQAGPSARGATAYVNLETGDCHGEDAAVRSLLEAGVSRVVVGLRHPLQHRRGEGISALRRAGVTVEVLGEETLLAGDEAQANAIQACLQVNEVRSDLTYLPFCTAFTSR